MCSHKVLRIFVFFFLASFRRIPSSLRQGMRDCLVWCAFISFFLRRRSERLISWISGLSIVWFWMMLIGWFCSGFSLAVCDPLVLLWRCWSGWYALEMSMCLTSDTAAAIRREFSLLGKIFAILSNNLLQWKI